MEKFKTIVTPEVVEAVAFDPEVHTKPEPVKEGEEPKEALVKQAEGDGNPYYVQGASGPLYLVPGDYIVRRADGELGVVKAEAFPNLFQPATAD